MIQFICLDFLGNAPKFARLKSAGTTIKFSLNQKRHVDRGGHTDLSDGKRVTC
jgi:hypothetical protein